MLPLRGASRLALASRWEGMYELLEAQRNAARASDDFEVAASMLAAPDTSRLGGQQEVACIRSSSGGPPGAFLTALPGGHMTMGNDIRCRGLAPVHRLGVHVPTDTPHVRAVQMRYRCCC